MTMRSSSIKRSPHTGSWQVNKNQPSTSIGEGLIMRLKLRRISTWFYLSPGVVVIKRYSSVSLGNSLAKGTMEPPTRIRPWPASALVM